MIKHNNPIKTLALDLEGTLISTVHSEVPRPGLHEFLDECHILFERIVIFTLVDEEEFREAATKLVKNGHAPSWYETAEYIEWDDDYKNLLYIPGIESAENAIIIDDNEFLIHPDQKKQWIQITDFDYPFPEDDTELKRVIGLLKSINS
jgi:hypothetical protein